MHVLSLTEILQKHDTAQGAVDQTRLTLKVMKTIFAKKSWVIPLLGSVLVAGALVAVKSYCNLEQRTHEAEALSATLGRLYDDQQLSMALKSMHDGDVKEAARRLDQLLCNNILLTNAERASADPRTQAFVEEAFRRIALTRPKVTSEGQAGPGQGSFESQAAVEKVLSGFLTSGQTVQAR